MQVDVIKPENRYIMVLDRNNQWVNTNLNAIHLRLQDALGYIVLIENVNKRRYISDAGILTVDNEQSDVTFVVVDHQNNYDLFKSTTDTNKW